MQQQPLHPRGLPRQPQRVRPRSPALGPGVCGEPAGLGRSRQVLPKDGSAVGALKGAMHRRLLGSWSEPSTALGSECAQGTRLCQGSGPEVKSLRSLRVEGVSWVVSEPLWATAQSVKNQPVMQETQVRFLHREDPLEKEMTIHSRILAWEMPWTEEPGGLQSMGL